jgi:hypothetical protein
MPLSSGLAPSGALPGAEDRSINVAGFNFSGSICDEIPLIGGIDVGPPAKLKGDDVDVGIKLALPGPAAPNDAAKDEIKDAAASTALSSTVAKRVFIRTMNEVEGDGSKSIFVSYRTSIANHTPMKREIIDCNPLMTRRFTC